MKLTSVEDVARISITAANEQKVAAGSPEWFTGDVQVRALFAPEGKSRTSGGQVSFEAGARSAWHTHPFGQALIITDGAGWVQEWGGAIRDMHAGDVIWIPADVKHWHGAQANAAVTHIAIQETQDGSAVTWMEQVSDEQYKGER